MMSLGFGGYRQVFRFTRSPRAEMNQESGFGCFLMVIVPLLLIVSTYLAWWELRFLVQGRTAVATVNGVQEVRMGRQFGGSYLEVGYTFKDELTDRFRSEGDELPLSWPHPDQTVRIQYVSGSPGGSRLEGHRHVFSTIFFIVCVTGSLMYGYLLVREARRAVREEELFESRRRRNPER
jgi:hypothetical protein